MYSDILYWNVYTCILKSCDMQCFLTLFQDIELPTDMEPLEMVKHTYICTVTGCNKSYTTRGGFRKHIASHTGHYRFWCDKCKKGFNEMHHYRDHMAQHEGRGVSCAFCGRTFSFNTALKRHIKTLHPNSGTWQLIEY